jgi:putative CocE/NonD family hydrolase
MRRTRVPAVAPELLLRLGKEVTGALSVKLWASSTAPDTDLTAKLVDVYPPSKDFPAGFDLGVQDGIIRARYRNSLEHAELMKPGDVYQISIDMYPTAMIFKKGHRIRIDISSSNFPRFDVGFGIGCRTTSPDESTPS